MYARNTTSSMWRVQGNLQTGRSVNSAVDDAVKYFKAKGLTDRAADFTGLKQDIDQKVSLLRAGIVGLASVEAVYKQMKGIVQTAKTADATTQATLSSEWSDLLSQVNSIALDSSYQGDNILQQDPISFMTSVKTFDPKNYFTLQKSVALSKSTVSGFGPESIQTAGDGSGISVLRISVPTLNIVSNQPPDTVPQSAQASISSKMPLYGNGHFMTDINGSPVYQVSSQYLTDPHGVVQLDMFGNPLTTNALIQAQNGLGTPLVDANGNPMYCVQQGAHYLSQTVAFTPPSGTMMYSSASSYPYMGSSLCVLNKPAGDNAQFSSATDICSATVGSVATGQPISVVGSGGPSGKLTNIQMNNDLAYDPASGVETGSYSATYTNNPGQGGPNFIEDGTYTFSYTASWAPGTPVSTSLVVIAHLPLGVPAARQSMGGNFRLTYQLRLDSTSHGVSPDPFHIHHTLRRCAAIGAVGCCPSPVGQER